jgi:WXG100 family type VII secretion target
MAQLGADVEQLDQLSKKFEQEAQQIAQATSQITSQVNSTWWKGPASDRFRASWESEFAPTLRRLEAALQQASQEVSRRHEALLQAGS